MVCKAKIKAVPGSTATTPSKGKPASGEQQKLKKENEQLRKELAEAKRCSSGSRDGNRNAQAPGDKGVEAEVVVVDDRRSEEVQKVDQQIDELLGCIKSL